MISWRKGVADAVRYAWREFLKSWGVDYPDRDEWRQTPWWHPMRWAFGKPMRYWSYDDYSIGGSYDGIWRYASYDECARDALQKECAPKEFTWDLYNRAVGELPDAAYIHRKEFPGDIGL